MCGQCYEGYEVEVSHCGNVLKIKAVTQAHSARRLY